MIQQQIENFTGSLSNLATEYSDPAIILQHIPVLKDNLMLQQNPEYILYGIGGVIALLIVLKRLRKRSKARVKNVSMVMPQPYLGDADHAHTDETSPASFEIEQVTTADPLDLSEFPAAIERTPRVKAEPTVRTLAQQLEDVRTVSFSAKTALTPDEARMRVLVQAAVNECGAGYLIMARTSLGALIQPGREAVGPERAHALSAIQDKCVDFGIFDRAGRCLVALEINSNEPALGNKALEKTIVKQALVQANIQVIPLNTTDTPAQIYAKTAPFLKATARPATLASPVQTQAPQALLSNRPTRPARPTRPVRPARAIAAE